MPEFNNRISKNPAITDNLQHLYFYNGSSLIEFDCAAKPGTRRSEHEWQIAKYTYSGSNVIEKAFANGSADFTFCSDMRGDYDYTISA